MNKFNRIKNPNWEPDALVLLTLFAIENDERKICVDSSFRPQYRVLNDYLTTTHHFFLEQESIMPGDRALAFIKLITPEAYPNCLDEGQIVDVCVGSKVIGMAEVKEIYNKQIKAF